MIDPNLISSRNDLPKYRYFFVRFSSTRIISLLPLQEYKIYVFDNPVTEERGKKILKTSNTEDIIAITEEEFPTGSFPHPKYTNQKNEPLRFLYKELEKVVVPISATRGV